MCSVSLSNNNVYCCLVDGKYFQGRGKNSWAYKHSVSESKHVFLKLDTEEVRDLIESGRLPLLSRQVCGSDG